MMANHLPRLPLLFLKQNKKWSKKSFRRQKEANSEDLHTDIMGFGNHSIRFYNTAAATRAES